MEFAALGNQDGGSRAAMECSSSRRPRWWLEGSCGVQQLSATKMVARGQLWSAAALGDQDGGLRAAMECSSSRRPRWWLEGSYGVQQLSATKMVARGQLWSLQLSATKMVARGQLWSAAALGDQDGGLRAAMECSSSRQPRWWLEGSYGVQQLSATKMVA